jgi:hypothetical protein
MIAGSNQALDFRVVLVSAITGAQEGYQHRVKPEIPKKVVHEIISPVVRTDHIADRSWASNHPSRILDENTSCPETSTVQALGASWFDLETYVMGCRWNGSATPTLRIRASVACRSWN